MNEDITEQEIQEMVDLLEAHDDVEKDGEMVMDLSEDLSEDNDLL